MTIIPAFCPLSGQLVLDQNSAILRGAQVYTYEAETTTARAVFQDYACTVNHPNPITVNAYGRIPAIYVDAGDYKVVLKDAAGSLIGSYEHLPGGQQTIDVTATPSGWFTGDLKPSFVTVPQDKWLIANGATIGDGNSGATARANDDTHDLFVALWNTNNPNFVVAPGRGASASADFVADKTITLPDLRGRVPAGIDKMGAAAFAGRLSAASTATPDLIGTVFGSDTATLNVAQLPTFTPSVTIGLAGSHGHSGSTDIQGAHSHGGSTSAAPDHVHPYTASNDSNVTTSGSAGTANKGTVTASTGPAGAHGHSIATDVQGAHQHGLIINAAPDHTHTATVSPIGSGGAHANMPPVILVNWYIRL